MLINTCWPNDWQKNTGIYLFLYDWVFFTKSYKELTHPVKSLMTWWLVTQWTTWHSLLPVIRRIQNLLHEFLLVYTLGNGHKSYYREIREQLSSRIWSEDQLELSANILNNVGNNWHVLKIPSFQNWIAVILKVYMFAYFLH